MKANEIAERAKALKGLHRTAVGCAGAHDWCAHFVSNVLQDVGVKNTYDTFCTPLKSKMTPENGWSEPETYPAAGDVIFFDWDHIQEERPLDHVGIVIDFIESTNTIKYIDGNGGGSQYVAEHTISVNNSSVEYWMRYIGDVSLSQSEIKRETAKTETAKTSDKTFDHTVRQLQKGCKGADVKSLQQLLFAKGYSVGNYGDDGDFGECTEKAVINFQSDRKITSDGIVGPKTYKELWGY